MSRLKLSENLFLEVAELQRLIKFLSDDGYKLIGKAITKSFGIVENAGNTYFKVTAKAGSNSVVVVNKGVALDSNLDGIVLNNDLELTVSNTGMNRWLILSRAVTNIEKGTVTVNTDGSLSGVGTEFTKVLRGQPNFPVKVKFSNSTQNNGEYEVVNVVSDASAVIAGSFVNESNLQYQVVGTFTPGFQPLEDNKLIYEYDSYAIRIVDSEDKPTVSADEFIIAGISFDSAGGMNISDERVYSMFNNPYVQSGGSEGASNNPLASLLNVSAIGGINAVNTVSVDFELIVEHGYTITKFELVTTSTTNSFNILTGSSNFLGTGNIPDNMFNGWLLVNRKNMKYAKIDSNTNKSLFISNFDTSMIEDNDNDFIVVPNFTEMEYQVQVSSNVNLPAKAFYFRSSIWNVATRMRIYAYFPSVATNFEDSITVTVKYRMLDNSGKQFPFANLAIAQFTNTKGQSETLSNSSFAIDLASIEPQAKQRNYS